MSRIFVIGAAGKVGQRLIKNLGDSGHEVVALHRKQEQAALIKQPAPCPCSATWSRWMHLRWPAQ